MAVISKDRLLKLLFGESELVNRLVMTPLLDPDGQIGEGSIDIRLGAHFIVTKTPQVGSLTAFEEASKLKQYQDRLYVSYGSELWIHPGTFVLGVTLEYIRLPLNVYADVTTRSSWARLGLNIATAVAVHPGFTGCLTLELFNAGSAPMAIYPGLRIGQLTFFDVLQPSEEPQGTRYGAQILPQFASLQRERPELERWRQFAT